MAAPTPAANAPAKKKSKLPLILIAAVLVIGAGVGGWMWRRSAEKPQAAAAAAPTAEVNSVLSLDSFVVNLQDPSGNGYLRVSIDLGLAAPAKEDDKDKQASYLPRLRDTILGVLGSQSVDALLTPDGKTQLKADLLKAINASVPELQCKEIYFTEFLVQH
jgi:flagellar protein FliL